MKEAIRLAWVDEARGLAILAMVFYHGAYDLSSLYGIEIPFFSSPLMEGVLHPFFAGLFLFLSGLSCRFSQNNLRRGFRLLGFALGLSLVTGLFAPTSFISFGILHLLAFCILLFCLLRPVLDKIPPIPAGSAFLGLFLLCRALLMEAPWWDQGGVGGFLLFVAGLPVRGFFSADYFPVLPWAMAFFAGACLGPVFCKTGSFFAGKPKIPLLADAGRNTLWIYLLHQPLLLGSFWLLFGG